MGWKCRAHESLTFRRGDCARVRPSRNAQILRVTTIGFGTTFGFGTTLGFGATIGFGATSRGNFFSSTEIGRRSRATRSKRRFRTPL
jgi:hypothetical protein